MASIGILGFGEIGQSLATVYSKHSNYDILIKDLVRDDGLINIECLNICIPYTDSFIDIVISQVKYSKPKFVIIHSTITPGTVEKLSKKLNVDIVHSPIMGVHPNLYDGMITFTKLIGAKDNSTAKKAKQHIESLGIKTHVCFPAVTTELGKILSTTYYGVIIAWHGEMQKMCNEFGANFDDAITRFNQIYNEGYTKLGKTNVVRPILYPPKDNKIGGHCVIPNTKLLKHNLKDVSKAIELILDYNK
tara:strand:- start:2419 stop:3159 length:741 start_codon:yes stop_codon:yes gene_type:complete